MHTFLSDGELLPMELIRRCHVNGYTMMAITDHASPSVMERQITEAKRDAELAASKWGLKILVGVELTHVPTNAIDTSAKTAKGLGAEIVVVHGETIVEPVEPGTNLAAVKSEWVDILAHPGILSEEEAETAAMSGVFLELSCRRGHCLGNGRTAKLAISTGARLLINSDAHSPGDIITAGYARNTAIAAGLSDSQVEEVMSYNPEQLLSRLSRTTRVAKGASEP